MLPQPIRGDRVGFDLVRRDNDFLRADIFEFHRIDDELLAQMLAESRFRQALMLQRLDHANAVAKLAPDPPFDLLVDVGFREFVTGGLEFIQDQLPLDESFHRVRLELFQPLLELLGLATELKLQEFFLNFPKGDDGVVARRRA